MIPNVLRSSGLDIAKSALVYGSYRLRPASDRMRPLQLNETVLVAPV